jgi:transporter family-2 protein
MGYWLVILIGLVGGLAVGIQSILAGAMGQKIGGTATSFIIHLGGMVFSGILLVLRGGERSGTGAACHGTCWERVSLG